MANPLLIAIVGIAGAGKSTSLQMIKDQPNWLYLNCENNKSLPFAHSFNEIVIKKPKDLVKYVKAGAKEARCKGIIIDTLTSALDMTEMDAKRTAEDGFKAWDEYRDWILDLFQNAIASCDKPVLVLCHVEQGKDIKGRAKLMIPVKGGVAKRGIENFFTDIVYADCVDLDELEGYGSPMLNITEDEKLDDSKYVLQTRKTGGGIGLNIRQTGNMWDRKETYIDCDINHVINKLKLTHKIT